MTRPSFSCIYYLLFEHRRNTGAWSSMIDKAASLLRSHVNKDPFRVFFPSSESLQVDSAR